MSESFPPESTQLAILSACQTAMGDKELPEEAIHLAAGMLNAEYRGVVGTMWSIQDETAPVLMENFYRALRRQLRKGRGELKSAHALHEATMKLFKKDRMNFMQWVPFIHMGI